MKKILVIFAILILAISLESCTKKKQGNFDYVDGSYFAADTTFDNGFRYWVVVTVKDKAIKSVVWNAYNADGGASKCLGDDKITCSEKGNYGLNGAKGTWDVQEKAAVDWIVQNQNISNITFNDDGTTDAITSVSISTKDLFALCNQALSNGAVAKGKYAKDGYYYIETTPATSTAYTYRTGTVDGTPITGTFDSYTFGTFVIVNSRIVIADFNATQVSYQYVLSPSDADPKNSANWLKGNIIGTVTPYVVAVQSDGVTPVQKYVTKDVSGYWYGMNWGGEAKQVGDKLVADQSLSFNIANGSGTIDGLSSVTIDHSVVSFKTILDELNAKM